MGVFEQNRLKDAKKEELKSSFPVEEFLKYKITFPKKEL